MTLACLRLRLSCCCCKVAIDKSTNSKPVSEKSLEEVPKTEYSIPDASSIQAFMSQAADLVECVELSSPV